MSRFHPLQPSSLTKKCHKTRKFRLTDLNSDKQVDQRKLSIDIILLQGDIGELAATELTEKFQILRSLLSQFCPFVTIRFDCNCAEKNDDRWFKLQKG